MIIGGNKEIRNYRDLYSTIKEDWELKQPLPGNTYSDDPRHDSFIYRYLKRINDERAEMLSGDVESAVRGSLGRTNQYQLIEAVSRSYGFGKISHLKALSLLEMLYDNDKRSSVTIRKWTDGIIGSSGNKKIAAELIFTDSRSKLPEYKDKLLFRNINDFLKDSSGTDSLYGDDVRLISEFNEYLGRSKVKKGISPESDAGRLYDSRYRDYCERLYSGVMSSGEYAPDAYIPLGFDEMSGAGLYIVGRNKCSKYSLDEYDGRIGKPRDVFFAVICFESWYDENRDIKTYGDIMVGQSIVLFDSMTDGLRYLKDRRGAFIEKYLVEDGSGIWNPYDDSYVTPLSAEEEAEVRAYDEMEKKAITRSHHPSSQ